ncbi:MAG: PEP/pyruvate-binding domain-containing protein [Planctomycetaceae bacterium]
MEGLVARFRRALGRDRAPALGLEARVACFREILHANNTALGYLTSIQEALAAARPLTGTEARRLVVGITVQAYRMIVNLERLTCRRDRTLRSRFDAARRAAARHVEVTPYLGAVDLVVPFESARVEMAEVLGQKNAFLAEARRVLPANVPDGFATSVTAFRSFMREAGLAEVAATLLAEQGAGDLASWFAVSARLSQAVERAKVPDDVTRALERAVADLVSSGFRRFAIRSSALQEGGLEVSFAGQYRSLLNVAPDGVVDAFRRVVASKYSPQAIAYRVGCGLDDVDVAMCCCVVPMIDARVAGVLYSAYGTPTGPVTLIQAVHGLGLSAVDGSVRPESVLLHRTSRRVVERRRGEQASMLACGPGDGTERRAAPRRESVITDDEALALGGLAWRLEDAFGANIDLEWAIDGAGRPWVLQVRPQRDHGAEPEATVEPAAGAEVLVAGGARASGGAASGPVHLVSGDLDLLRCPAGAVVVCREANPRFAVLLSAAAAVVADLGDVTGHLAAVARELRVPAIFGARDATARLGDGEPVTVDADARAVYRGRVDAVLAARNRPRRALRNPYLERLSAAAPSIVPLTLTDRLASGYRSRRCRTIHDIIRYCHQRTVESMFAVGDGELRRGGALRRLRADAPIDCRLLDLGGGIRPGCDCDEVGAEDLTCVPLRALLRGLCDERLSWRSTRPVSVRGFMSALVNYNFDEDARVRAMGEPSYAFVTGDYLNLNSRIGYHFSTVDARVGSIVESNYASFRFVGGSTGVEQRSRRAWLLQRILSARGFETDCRADLVNARLRRRPAQEMEEALGLIGLVSGYVNHLDMALTSDALVDEYERQFNAGNYGYK